MNIHDDPAALKALQDDIYREKVLRARKQSPAERLADAFEITNFVFGNMLSGAMAQKGLKTESEGWEEVRLRLERLSRVHDHGRYATEKPLAA